MKQVIHEQGARPIKVWTDEVEATALAQLKGIAQLPFIHPHGVAAMPDVHTGIGATVGSVIATEQVSRVLSWIWRPTPGSRVTASKSSGSSVVVVLAAFTAFSLTSGPIVSEMPPAPARPGVPVAPTGPDGPNAPVTPAGPCAPLGPPTPCGP